MQHFCNTFIEKVICNRSPLFLLPAGICIGTDAGAGPERCRCQYPDTDHFSADHPWSYLHSSKYNLRYCDPLCKCSGAPYGPLGKKAQEHLGRNAVFTAIFTFLAFAIAQFGLMTVVKKGYAYLGYAAFITLFVPFVVHAVATKGKEI